MGLILIGKYWPAIQEAKYKWEAERFDKMIADQKKKQEDAERADTYGGKTPEETFDLFLEALKKDDVALVSKYYEVKIQDKALESFKKELAEKGNLSQSLAYFLDVRKGVKKCADVDKEYGGCVFEFEYVTDNNITATVSNSQITISKGDKSIKSIEIGSNDISNLWKISWPY